MIPKSISDKVLTVGPDPEGKGGIASVVQYYRDELFTKWNFIAEARATGGKAIKLVDAITACMKLIFILKAHKNIRVVHLHTAGKISFPRSCLFMRISRFMGRKVVMHMHSGTFPTYCRGKEKKVRKALMQADAVIVLGEKWIQYYKDNFDLQNLFVLPNIVPDAKSIAEISTRGNADVVHALFLGQLVETKGIYDLLEALSLIKGKLQDRFILHVGGKGDINFFTSEVERLGLDKMVVYEGWVGGNKKNELLNKSSISILPSYFEGLPISLLEGMTYGHALISTDVGSIPEIIDSSNGILIQSGKPMDIAEALVSLLDNRKKLIDMGEASRELVKPYLPGNVSARLTGIYESLLNG